MNFNYKQAIRRMPWHANMTDKNHLGRALLSKPHAFEGPIRKIFAAMDYGHAPTFHKLSSENRVKEITGTDYTWRLQGKHERPLVAVENLNTVEKPGLRNTLFKLKLDQDWRLPGDILSPGDVNKKFSVRVMSDARPHGDGSYVYEVQLLDSDPALFMPPKYLEGGWPWSKMNAQYEEGAKQSGSTTYALPFELTNRISRFRKQYSVTGDAHDDVLAVAVPDKDGNMHKMWVKYAEAVYWMQWYRELELSLWYNRDSGGKLKGSTGRPVRSGPGLQQLLENGHRETYNKLTARLIEDFFSSIFFGRVSPEGNRKLIGYAGERAMLNFHRAVMDFGQKSGFIQVVDDKFIQNASSPYHSNALSMGWQFTTYKMANNATLELRHNPCYDMKEYNQEIASDGFPKESHRITFLDLHTEDGESNINLIKRKGAFRLGYKHGLATPYGPVNNESMAMTDDAYEVHMQDDLGINIEDVSRTGELILA